MFVRLRPYSQCPSCAHDRGRERGGTPFCSANTIEYWHTTTIKVASIGPRWATQASAEKESKQEVGNFVNEY